MTFAIKICCSHQAPVDRKSWPVAAADIGVVVQIPDRCLISRRIEQYIILETVAVKVAYGSPASQWRCWRGRRRRHRAGRAVELNPIEIRGPVTNDRIVELKRVAAGVQSDRYLF